MKPKIVGWGLFFNDSKLFFNILNTNAPVNENEDTVSTATIKASPDRIIMASNACPSLIVWMPSCHKNKQACDKMSGGTIHNSARFYNIHVFLLVLVIIFLMDEHGTLIAHIFSGYNSIFFWRKYRYVALVWISFSFNEKFVMVFVAFFFHICIILNSQLHASSQNIQGECDGKSWNLQID